MNGVVEALRSLEGVAGVELHDRPDGSVSVRIALSQEADETEIASLARRILDWHGLRAASVQGARGEVRVEPHGSGPPARHAPRPPPMPAAARRVPVDVTSVSVTERPDGVVVEVVVDGRSLTRPVTGGPEAVRLEVARATAQLTVGDRPAPAVIGCSVHETGGHTVATVVLDDGSGTPPVGSALVRAGEPMAIARAVLRALRG